MTKELTDVIYDSMLDERSHKYRELMWIITTFKLVGQTPLFKDTKTAIQRGDFFDAMYCAMRRFDDFADLDEELPQHYKSTVEQYLQSKIDFLKDPNKIKDDLDILLLKILNLSEKIGFRITEECENIINSLIFDARRINKYQIFERKELEHHFHMLDIVGTVKAMLKVYAEDPSTYRSLIPLGKAMRLYYDLRDFAEDLSRGFINIPKEDVNELNITILDLNQANSLGQNYKNKIKRLNDYYKSLNILEKTLFYKKYKSSLRQAENKYILSLPFSIQKWFKEITRQGLNFIQEHKKEPIIKTYSPVTRLTLQVGYVDDALPYLKRVNRLLRNL